MTTEQTHRLPTLRFEYDPWTDVLTVEGINYSGELFRTLAFPRTDRLYQFRREGANVDRKGPWPCAIGL